MNKKFELGPIRPPSEATSILLRITRNCPWNRCAFCPVYKGERFSLRTVEEVKSDIDTIYYIAEKIKEIEKRSNRGIYSNRAEIDAPDEFVRQVMFWHSYGMKTLFLQDADSLVIKTEKLVEILKYMKDKFPTIERITSYARSKTLSRKSLDELKSLREAGLTRIHTGMESGSDNVLKMLEKGVTSKEQTDAGQKAVEAGFELSEYYMPGSGGKEYTKENAIESARVINEINPHFIRLRSTVPRPGTPLYDLMTDNNWTPLTEEGKVKEIRLFIENLNNITSVIKSDHFMNLIEDIEGRFPEDRERLIGIVDKFLKMPPEDRESYIIGRRTGRFRYLSDFRHDREVEAIKEHLMQNFSSIEDAALELLRNYI